MVCVAASIVQAGQWRQIHDIFMDLSPFYIVYYIDQSEVKVYNENIQLSLSILGRKLVSYIKKGVENATIIVVATMISLGAVLVATFMLIDRLHSGDSVVVPNPTASLSQKATDWPFDENMLLVPNVTTGHVAGSTDFVQQLLLALTGETP